MSHYRKITVNDQEYKYVIGRSYLKIRGLPAVNLHRWTGLDIERGRWKGWFAITPQNVRDYIEGKPYLQYRA